MSIVWRQECIFVRYEFLCIHYIKPSESFFSSLLQLKFEPLKEVKFLGIVTLYPKRGLESTEIRF